MMNKLQENNSTIKKYNELTKYLKKLGKVAVAFSGGVDSTFLLKTAKETLGEDNVLAVTAIAPYIPKWEIDEAKKYTKILSVSHEFIYMNIEENIENNPENRCYLCKKNIFKSIKYKAAELGYNKVIDGTNYDDLDDYRPGLKALEELEILSPMSECKLAKKDIRDLSKDMKLKTWNKPAYACLLTRIPNDTKVTKEELEKIEKAEKFLFSIGLYSIRVRSHKDLARIELGEKEKEILKDGNALNLISKELKDIGYKYVTVDIDGYKMGSFNKLQGGSNE